MSEEKMKVVMVEPNKSAYVTEIGCDLQSLKAAVGGGYIEPIYFLHDSIMVGNEEAKLLGMDGNRRFADSVVAGPFFICGEKMTEDGAEFCSLDDKLISKYLDLFRVPEQISREEVEADMVIKFIPIM